MIGIAVAHFADILLDVGVGGEQQQVDVGVGG
jgi:hypothetical protein